MQTTKDPNFQFLHTVAPPSRTPGGSPPSAANHRPSPTRSRYWVAVLASKKKHMAEDGESAAASPAYAEMDFPEERRTSLKAAFEKAAKEGRVEHKEVRCVCVRPEDLCPQG